MLDEDTWQIEFISPSDKSGENQCKAGEFRCHSDGSCIPGDWRCDGVVDCARDAADEEECGE